MQHQITLKDRNRDEETENQEPKQFPNEVYVAMKKRRYLRLHYLILVLYFLNRNVAYS